MPAGAGAKKTKKRKKSVLKRAKQSRQREAVNRANRTQVRTAVKRLRAAIDSGDTKASADLLRPTLAALDHAIAKGVLHANTGNRYKSRLALAYNSLHTARKA